MFVAFELFRGSHWLCLKSECDRLRRVAVAEFSPAFQGRGYFPKRLASRQRHEFVVSLR